MKSDLQVWQTFFELFSGVSFWCQELRLEAELQVSSDAAGSLGFGVYFQGHWSVGEWPKAWIRDGWTRDLMFLELFAIWVVIWVWGKEMADRVVHFWCDSMAVV